MSHHYNSPCEGISPGCHIQKPQRTKLAPSTKRSRHPSSGSGGEANDSGTPRVRSTGSKRRTSAKDDNTRMIPFACPFVKLDPLTFSGPKWRCHKKELTRIRDVKQHLCRRHRPPYCTRCGETFESEQDLEQHSRIQVACPLVSPPRVPYGTISKELQAHLSRKPPSARYKDHEGQWFSVFEMVFPGQPHPETPFDDDFHNFAAFRDFALAEAPATFASIFPEVAEQGREAFDQKIGEGFRAVYSQWAKRNAMTAEVWSISWSRNLCSNLGTAQFTSPSSSIMADRPTDFTLQPESYFPMAPPTDQDLVAESKAVQVAREGLRLGPPTTSMYISPVSSEPKVDEFPWNNGILPGQMWQSFDETYLNLAG